jgi:pilus assembly protein CpaB
MTRPNAVVVVAAVALIFAGLASWGVYTYLEKQTAKTKSASLDKAVVAAADLAVGTKLNATQVKVVDWPKENRPAGSFSDSSAVTDRVVVKPVSAGDVITEQKLLPKDAKGGAGIMAYAVPAGHRAVTVAVNEVAGVAGFIAPGNRVDIVLTTQIPSNPSDKISKIILQDVPVLATGQISTAPQGEKPVVVPTVTLDLTPDDSEKLVLATSKGSLQLLLRNVIDSAPVDSRGATITKVLTGSETHPLKVTSARKSHRRAPARHVQARPTPPPPSTHSVEVIRGASKSTKQFAPEQ